MPGPTPYFDASPSSADLALLPNQLRADQDLLTLADIVQADIVARYTISTFEAPAYWEAQGEWGWIASGTSDLDGMVKLADTLYVRLRGYAPDADDAETYFREAMRREIGAVLRWRITQFRRDPAITTESGDKSMTYREDAEEPFPPTFPHYLGPFVLQDGSWSL